MAKQKCGIYAITHADSGKKYVGQSAKIRDRWLWHKSALRRGTHTNRKLQNAWNKYGEDAFTFALLEQTAADEAAICACEQKWIDLLRPAYNLAPVAGTTRGIKHPPRSAAFRKKMSAIAKGREPNEASLAGLAKGRANRTFTAEQRAARSRRMTGRKLGPETLKKMRAANLGKKQPPETVEKRARSLRGRKRTPEQCARISAAKQGHGLGTKQSPETCAKKSAAMRGKKRPQHLLDRMHKGKRAAAAARYAAWVPIAAAHPGLSNNKLAGILGCSHHTVARFKVWLSCQ